jgi:hypothetical protein
VAADDEEDDDRAALDDERRITLSLADELDGLALRVTRGEVQMSVAAPCYDLFHQTALRRLDKSIISPKIQQAQQGFFYKSSIFSKLRVQKIICFRINY